MPNEGRKEYLKILGVDNCSSENEIKRAYKKLALQCHPDKNSDITGRKQFDEISKAFGSLTLEYRNDSYRQDYDQVFFDFLLDIFGWKEDSEGASNSNFLMYFCGSKQHPGASDTDFDLRYQDTEEEDDVDGESDIDSIMEIVKNRRKKGKHVPEEFKEEILLDMKTKINQHKEDMKRDACKKQASKKGKTPVPVAKPKPKSKKQLQAEQRRREKEMEKIAMELEEKRKEEEEKEKQRKQLEVEKQKRLEEERIRAQNEERKRREKEQKERERQQKLEQEREEKRRRQQEEEKKRKEEEDKRKKAEKEKADKEKAAKKAAQQAAKEKEDKEKAASKNQSMKRQQQQQRTDQQQYPREIPPRFQKKMKQKEQQQQTQFQPPQQQIQQQTISQQMKVQTKPQPTVAKKKDPNRFASKEYADIIEPMDDSGWTQGAPGKGSGWGNSLDTWEDAEKWGAEDRHWGNKEGMWDKLVVDEGDKETWPTVGSKGTIGDKLKTSSSDTGSEKGQFSAESSPKTSVSSMPSAVKPENSGTTAQGSVLSNVDKKSLPSSHWSGVYPTPTENWDVIDESIDQAIDAVDAATVKDNIGLNAGWGGVAKGGLGGLIGTSPNWESSLNTKDSSATAQSNESRKTESSSNVSETANWSKTPGKSSKPKVTTTSSSESNSMTASWGGTPAESDLKWIEPNSSSDGVANSKESKQTKVDSNFVAKSGEESKSEQSVTPTSSAKITTTGWGDVPTTSSSNWRASVDITGTSCWDSIAPKSDSSELKASSNSKVSQWLESSGVSIGDLEWGHDSLDHEEGSEGSLDGWTTASKRNRAPKPANDSNAWMTRSLKQLLDMGFKQEDAEKALKANHMNIESAIGDLLAMNMSENKDQMSAVPAEPDPAEAARIQQQQQQSQSKLNRKQRRKLQQQQQAEQQTVVATPDTKQAPNELSVSKPASQSSETLAKSTSEQPNKTSDSTYTSKTEDIQRQEDSNTKQASASTTKNEKPVQSVSTPKAVNGQAQSSGNGKRTGMPIIPPTAGPGVQAPLRPPLAHPLLHPQFVQQLHLQQLRMAQGGLLQPPFTPQQFAMLQQIAQLQFVQQRLAAQSVAQQHMGQKQQIVPQQQLYQQQQQIALMIAQMQQQVLQQQPGLAGRHPALQFAAVQPSLNQQQQSSPSSQQKGNKPVTNEKTVPSESPQTKTTDTVTSESNETPSVPPVTVEEQTKQPSPVPQSRLTQWKQPLLQDPTTTSSQPSVTSSTPTTVDSKPLTVSTSSQSASSVLPSVVSAPSVSTGDGSDLSAPSSNNVSPRTRIPDPVSSKWGVDAGPKLSADPPEFKPGVPWRPNPKTDKRDDGRDVNSSSVTTEVSSRSSPSSGDSQSDSWSTTGNQTVSLANSLPPLSSAKAVDETVHTTTNSGFSGLSINSSTFESSQIDFGLNSTPWQATETKAPVPVLQGVNKPGSSVASLLRPPPGLGSDSALPESPLFEEEPPPWLKNLIDTGFNGDNSQPEFQFSRFGFANNSAPWSPQDAGAQPFSPLTPNPQPWAAVGGPTPTLSSSGSTVPMATNDSVRSVSSGSASEPPNLQNSGIIWSTNQPIPSAEEKLTVLHPVASVPPVSASAAVAPTRSTTNSMSTWLVLRNLSPRMDPKSLRPLCERHGPLLTFQLNLRHGNSLIRYGSMDEAAKARVALNGLTLNGVQVAADFATDSDIGSFFEQTMDWSANPFPSNTYGNQWSFQNMLGSSAASDGIQTAAKAPLAKNSVPSAPSEQSASKVGNPAAGMQWGAAVGPMPPQSVPGTEQSKINAPVVQWGSGLQGSEQPGAKANTVAPSIPWGNASGTSGAAQAPSYLWGSGPTQQVLGGNFSQVPSMWSFPAGMPRDAEPQSGSGDGLVSPSMTTFLPPGLLNGGGDSV